MELKDKLISELDSQYFPPRGAALIVAVSGGVDSVVLLHILYLLSVQHDWEIIVAHFDHCLRALSHRDVLFVKQLADNFGLKFVTSSANIKQIAAINKLTIEEAGREQRYNWLQKIADQHQASVIVTAHTADDQAETITMNWLRGGLIRALAGMRIREGKIWRPFLYTSKAELYKFAKTYQLKFREDASNKNLAYRRNVIRHRILPVLEKVNPNIKAVLGRNAASLSGLEDWLTLYTQDIYKNVSLRHQTDEVNFAEDKFRKLAKFLQNELLLLAIQKLSGSRQDIKKVHLDEIQAIFASREAKTWKQIPGKLFVSRGYGRISVSRRQPKFVKK